MDITFSYYYLNVTIIQISKEISEEFITAYPVFYSCLQWLKSQSVMVVVLVLTNALWEP